ncbi:acyl CoA ligase-like protein [Spathaspora passalidarum NRRL Y-27907]|uniref:Acyl CoA ligase-like protein n=1 Tax=Spathaspora passalidarum (strain NRRL Y-27907 / 11-Y1) TaxID=619300 RepID=G3AUK1_SPAPN|nr:acyl CoA ligase-like protein [Spathaspora passalidarum NRRL Y-27907]EGW30557.1 acyl CoA ligase-like protein [Spathaspora passalidarum NRRL Y-27907]
MSHSGSGHSSRQYLGTGQNPATNSSGGVAGGAGNSAPGDSLGINNQPQVLTGASPNIVAGGTTSAVDIPPDMAVLLSKLDQDFMVDKTIDQWTYINRREEIMQSITRLHQRQQQQQSDDWAVLDPDQLETPLNPRRSFDIQQDSPSDLVNILESRARIYKSETAFMVLDIRGKEVSSITWEKLYLKAVKVCYEILHKLSLTNNDTVVLLYKDGEVAEFVVALFGCFMAGVTAIPIHQDISLTEVLEIIKLTSTKLLLYSETVAKELDRLNTQAQPINWPSKLMRWRTTEFGSAKKSELSHWQMKQSQRKRSNSQTQTQNNQNLAYVEFSRSPLGELRGIALSHRTISHQMNCLNVALSSLPNSDNLQRSYTQYQRNCKVVLATLDIRFSIGIIMGILFTVYSGNVHIWAPQRVMEVQGLYANIISKCKASLLLADYIGLKRVTYDYQQSPNATRYFSKTQRVDFSSVKWVLVNALTIDGEFVEILSQRYLRPLGCQRPDNAVIPMLTLSDYGGMVISLRDWIGSQEKLGVPLGDDDDSSDLSSVLIDKEALSRNIVKIVETNPSAFDDISHDLLRVDAFGYPIPDATLAVVNPESSILVSKGELGEIWIDSPCLSGGFYGLRKESKSIFRARCRGAYGYLEMEFLRTGLLGFTYNGKVYVLGLYEDRIRQRVSWIDQKLYKKLNRDLIIGNNGSRYHYSSHLLATLAREVKQVYDCTIFDIFIGNEYLPVAIVEAEVIRKTVEDSNQDSNEAADDYVSSSAVPLNEPVLNAIAQKCFDTLYRRHFLRLYCVLVVDCDTLPKIMRSGGREIANMLCKKRFLEGSLRAEFVKFFVRKSISMIPHGEDIIGGIWSPYVSELRSMALANFPNQYSNVDYRDSSLDDKTGAPLTDFKTIIDILKFRVARSGDSIAFHNLDNGSSSSKSKPLTWKKLEHRAYSVCHYLIEKASIKPGQYVILMYSLSEEFVVAVYACLICGIIPIPMLPFDSNRIGEDFPAFVGVIKDFDVSEILVNDEVEKFLKNGPVADSLKKISHKKVKALRIKNTVKLTKLSNIASLNSKIATYQAAVNFRDSHTTAMVWLNFTSDHYRVGTVLSHSNIIGMCKVFKETCNLNSKTPIVGCVRHASGIGFIQACLLGVFLGTTTYLVSPVSYAENPLQFFLTLARYKVKDAFVTEQMLKYAAIKFSPKGFNLSNLKNMMISTENRRVEIDFLRKISKVFSPTKLSAAAMSTVYNHYFNPMISTRSYMTVAPVDLYLDPLALRQGYVSVVNQADFPNALHIQDSGMVPVCTEIAIVNPETRRVCKEGEFGEIWVKSDANLNSFTNGPKGPVDSLSQAQFNAQIVGGDPQSKYARTGDLGFLHHISITKNDGGENGQEGGEAGGGRRSSNITSFQPLFVLGKIADTFEVMGLHHFPIDIENTIESCHSDIYNNGSCVFKCSDYTIVVCESKRTRYYSSLVPLIVNTVFSKHHIIIDIVAFIKKGEFPISRLGTKQRARIVDAWVQGVIPLSASYGVNYGENSMIKLIKDIDVVAREDPVMGLKNPALSYYDTDMDDDVFADDRQPLTLNQAQPSGNAVFNNSGAFESNSTSEIIM